MVKKQIWLHEALVKLKKKKTAHAYFWAPYFFLSFLAGKFWIVKQPIMNSFSRSNKIAISTFAYTPQNWRTSVSLNSSDPREKGSTSVLYLWILLQSFLFDPSLMVRDIRRSIWNKIEINDKLIRAIELRVVVCMKKYKH